MSSEHDIKGPEPRFAAWLMEPMRRNRPVYLKVAPGGRADQSSGF